MVLPRHPPDRLLDNVAELRARGASWESTAHELDTTTEHIYNEVNADRSVYLRLRARAGKDVLDEVFAEALLVARRDLRSDNDRFRQQAYDLLFRVYAS